MKKLELFFAYFLFVIVVITIPIFTIVMLFYVNHSNWQERIAKFQIIVDENNGEFKVLHSYPAYNNKGMFINHVVVLEGVKNQKRIEAPSKPCLPIPGEIWEVEVRAIRNTSEIKYECVKKINGETK